jgi:hypothetical protein
VEEWRDAMAAHGFAIAHEEVLEKEMDFAYWAGRHDAAMQAYLRAMLEHATADVKQVLKPENKPSGLTFCLREALFIARLVANG